jgi:predicted nucleic acid-binding Zn ribbon protein
VLIPEQMDHLIKTLPKILQAAGESPEVAEAACLVAWKHAAGDGLRDHAVPLRLSLKTLVIGVADTTWQKQLRSLSGQLLFRLNSILGQPLVTFIDFRVDPRAVANARSPQHANRIGGEFDPSIVSVELVTAAAEIKDKDLRRAFLGAAVSCINRMDRSRVLKPST